MFGGVEWCYSGVYDGMMVMNHDVMLYSETHLLKIRNNLIKLKTFYGDTRLLK